MDQEIEAKFYLGDLSAFKQKLDALGATTTIPRTLEINLRFDTADGRLGAAGQVLRLRQDWSTHLTFKAPQLPQSGVLTRTEIEFEVSNFGAAQRFLEALGYRVFSSYEKYRETYQYEGAMITLDELPFGCFVEIEADSGEIVRNVAALLALNWQAHINLSYLELFYRLRQARHLPFDKVSFANFEGLTIKAEELGVEPAD